MNERPCEPTPCSGHSCVFSFRHFGPVRPGPKLCKKNFFRRQAEGSKSGSSRRAARLELAFGGTISVPAEVRVPGAGCQGCQTAADFLGLVPVQFAGTPPNQYSAFVVHACSPFSSFWVR